MSGRSRERGERGGREQGGRLPVEIDGGVRMVSQDRRGRHRTDGPIETSLDSRCFAGIGNDGEDFSGLENLTHGHGDGLLRNSFEIWKPPFADLLETARMIEGDNDVGLLRVEIGGRIVERHMSIFADTQENDVNRRSSDGLAGATNHL